MAARCPHPGSARRSLSGHVVLFFLEIWPAISFGLRLWGGGRRHCAYPWVSDSIAYLARLTPNSAFWTPRSFSLSSGSSSFSCVRQSGSFTFWAHVCLSHAAVDMVYFLIMLVHRHVCSWASLWFHRCSCRDTEPLLLFKHALICSPSLGIRQYDD